MNIQYRAVAIAAVLAGSSCAVPKPAATPAPLVETDDDPEPAFAVTGCEDDGCVEACESEPKQRWEACSEAYEAGCFSERPPQEYDCEEFGSLSEEPKKKKKADSSKDAETPLDDDADVSSGEEDSSSPLLDRPHPD